MPTTDKHACAQHCAHCPYRPNLANANLAQQLMMHIEQMATGERRQMVLLIDAILASSQAANNATDTSTSTTSKPKRSKKR